MLNHLTEPQNSTSVLIAFPGKLDIKRYLVFSISIELSRRQSHFDSDGHSHSVSALSIFKNLTILYINLVKVASSLPISGPLLSQSLVLGSSPDS